MKKMFLLLMTVGVFSAAMAQPRQERRDVVLGQQTGRGGYGGFYGDRDDRYGNDRYSGNSFTPRERDAAIRMINHEFDDRIWAVRRSRYLSQFDKERQIRFLNAQRVQEIRRVNDRFNDRRNGYYDNRSYRNNRRF